MKDSTVTKPSTGLQQLTGMFERYRKALAKTVARIVKPHDIEDIVQETYVRIFQASQKTPIHHPRSFMLKTARNIALNHVARADAMNHLAAQEQESDADSDSPVDEAQLSEPLDVTVQAEEEFVIFCRAIRKLPLQCRRAFILKKVYGMSQREVAGHLGISEGTVEQHLAKGVVACHAYMKAHGYARADRARPSAVASRKAS